MQSILTNKQPIQSALAILRKQRGCQNAVAVESKLSNGYYAVTVYHLPGGPKHVIAPSRTACYGKIIAAIQNKETNS